MFCQFSFIAYVERSIPIDTKIPIQKPFDVNLGIGLVSYPACSPTYLELFSGSLSSRSPRRKFGVFILSVNVNQGKRRGPRCHNWRDTQGTLYTRNLGNALGSSVLPRLLLGPSPWARDRTGLTGVRDDGGALWGGTWRKSNLTDDEHHAR